MTQPTDRPAEKCCVCGSPDVTYRNYREQPFCWPCADCQCTLTPCVRETLYKPAQPTDRPGIDHLTSDQLDQLYGEIDTLRSVCQSNKQAYVGAVKHAWEVEERAKQAEATLTTVRELHAPAQDWSWQGFGCDHGGTHTQLCSHCKTCHPCPTIAVLDQHGQTPA